MTLFSFVKKLLNKAGYDIRYHHPFYETIVAPLGIKTILDIGANTGRYAQEMRERFPRATLHAFEPLKDCFLELDAFAQGESGIHAHNYALGSESGGHEIERSNFHPSSSLLPMTKLHTTLYPKSAGGIKERITIRRLDDVAESLSLSTPMLVKMDVQGFEGKVIEGGTETLMKASIILIETSFFVLYENQPLFNTISSQLGALGFTYYGSYHTHFSKKTGRPIYEDSVFISAEVAKKFEEDELNATK